MKKLHILMSLCLSALIALSCGKENPVDENKDDNIEKPVEKAEFNIEIYDLHSSYCKVRVTPGNLTDTYFCSVATEAYLSEFGSLDDIETTVTNFIETEMIMNPDTPISEMLKKGVYERDVTGLQPEQKFVVFACHTNEIGEITSDITIVYETTPPVADSQNSFEIEIDQITATSATLFITPSNDDDYVWLEFPDYVYEGMSMEELEDFLLKNYKPFFPLHTNSGEMIHLFDGNLDPDTEYMIIVFGYDGGLTTPLFTETFRTLPPNDPTDVTFTFEMGEMTSRSASITFKPSDNSVSYLAIVTDEELLEKHGGPTEEGVEKLIDSQIKKAIIKGECEDRAEFAELYSRRGEQEGNFSVTAGMKHYACAVCVDKEGNYASAVSIAEFTAPSAEDTDASVKAEFDKYYNGDDLAKLDPVAYGDWAGWAVLPIKFTLEGSAFDALYSIFPVSFIEEEGATEEEIRALMMDTTFLDEYVFHIQDEEIVQLEWGYEYMLYVLPIDINDNAGELVSYTIPALTKIGASPASEF